MTKATTAKGVGLFVKKDGSTWSPFHEVSSVPEIGQTADKIDATSLESDMKVYIPDIPDYSSDLEFTMNAIPSGEVESNFDLLEGMDPDKIYEWKIVYPQQKVQCTIMGRFVWRMGSAQVSTKQDIIMTIIPSSAPTWSDYEAVVSITYAEGSA